MPNVYLADLPEVTEAKVAFMKVFDAYKAGKIPLPVAPVHEVKPVCNIFLFCFAYRKVASSRLSRLVAHFHFFRLFMKGNFDA